MSQESQNHLSVNDDGMSSSKSLSNTNINIISIQRPCRKTKNIDRLGFTDETGNDSGSDFDDDASADSWKPNEKDADVSSSSDDEENQNPSKKHKPNTLNGQRPPEMLMTAESQTNDDHFFNSVDIQQEVIVSTLASEIHSITERVPQEGENTHNQSTETAISTENVPQNKRTFDRSTENKALAEMSPGERIIFNTIMGLAADVKVLKRMILCSRSPTQTEAH